MILLPAILRHHLLCDGLFYDSPSDNCPSYVHDSRRVRHLAIVCNKWRSKELVPADGTHRSGVRNRVHPVQETRAGLEMVSTRYDDDDDNYGQRQFWWRYLHNVIPRTLVQEVKLNSSVVSWVRRSTRPLLSRAWRVNCGHACAVGRLDKAMQGDLWCIQTSLGYVRWKTSCRKGMDYLAGMVRTCELVLHFVRYGLLLLGIYYNICLLNHKWLVTIEVYEIRPSTQASYTIGSGTTKQEN